MVTLPAFGDYPYTLWRKREDHEKPAWAIIERQFGSVDECAAFVNEIEEKRNGT